MANYLNGTLHSARVILGVHIRGHKGKQAVCVGKALSGRKFSGGRPEVKLALAAAARNCGKGK
jgi:hypothetical protein